MSWVFEQIVIDSAQNGRIIARRTFGRWRVRVGGIVQTGYEANRVWREALRNIRMPSAPRVLMLGLGAGGLIPYLHECFPGCAVTAVEHDEEMVGLFHELRLYEPWPEPKILPGDAGVCAAALAGSFELVLVDIFYKNQPSPLLGEDSFVADMRRLLAPEGQLLANVADNEQALRRLRAEFSGGQTIRSRNNYFGLFHR